MNHVNIEVDETTVPYYAEHVDGKISGFFGVFRFLSNFYPCKEGVWFDELVYPSVEHAYQAAKWPRNLRNQFLECTAGQSKRLGKTAPFFNAKKWTKKKYDLMYALNWSKYTNDHVLKKKLMEMEGYQLEERNSWGDTDWGVDEKGEGQNNLGKILMQIRDKLIAMEKGDEW